MSGYVYLFCIWQSVVREARPSFPATRQRLCSHLSVYFNNPTHHRDHSHFFIFFYANLMRSVGNITRDPRCHQRATMNSMKRAVSELANEKFPLLKAHLSLVVYRHKFARRRVSQFFTHRHNISEYLDCHLHTMGLCCLSLSEPGPAGADGDHQQQHAGCAAGSGWPGICRESTSPGPRLGKSPLKNDILGRMHPHPSLYRNSLRRHLHQIKIHHVSQMSLGSGSDCKYGGCVWFSSVSKAVGVVQPQSFNPAQETLCELKISHCDESQHLSLSSPPERHPGLGFRTKWMSPNMKSTLKLMPSQLEQHLWSISLQVSAQENTNQLNDGAFTSFSVYIKFKSRNPPWTKLPIKWIKYTER